MTNSILKNSFQSNLNVEKKAKVYEIGVVINILRKFAFKLKSRINKIKFKGRGDSIIKNEHMFLLY